MKRSDTGSDVSRDRTRYKTGQLIENYGFEDLDGELVDRWTSAGDDSASLRQLADEINTRTLSVTMRDAGMDPLDGEVENIYRLLTDDVSGGDRIRAERRLERNGIDVESLKNDFVTHQAIHTYLTNFHGVQKSNEDGGRDQVTANVQSLNRLISRLRRVTENTVERFRSTGRIDIAAPRILIDVQVTCQQCGETYDIADLPQVTSCSCRD